MLTKSTYFSQSEIADNLCPFKMFYFYYILPICIETKHSALTGLSPQIPNLTRLHSFHGWLEICLTTLASRQDLTVQCLSQTILSQIGLRWTTSIHWVSNQIPSSYSNPSNCACVLQIIEVHHRVRFELNLKIHLIHIHI